MAKINVDKPNKRTDGTTEDDVITGTSGIDMVYAGKGNDKIYGSFGADQLFGEDGNDTIFGGTGIDWLDGGTGNDTLYAVDETLVDAKYTAQTGAGSLLVGGLGNDTVVGGNFSDTMYAGFYPGGNVDFRFGDINSNNKMYGMSGFDLMYGSDGVEYMEGGWGDDSMYGGHSKDELHGNQGNDKVFGGIGADKIFGEDGNDILVGDSRLDKASTYALTAGEDTMNGGAGNDTFYAGYHVTSRGQFSTLQTGRDYIDGGDGKDVLVLQGSRSQVSIRDTAGFKVVSLKDYDAYTKSVEYVYFLGADNKLGGTGSNADELYQINGNSLSKIVTPVGIKTVSAFGIDVADIAGLL